VLAGKVEAIHAEAFHERNKWDGLIRRRQQTFQFIRSDHHHRVVTTHSHALRPFRAGAPYDLAEPRLGVL